MKTCVIVPEQGGYSETFIRAHIEQLPGNVTYLYGGLFPTRKPNGDFLLPAPSFTQRVGRSLLNRLFSINFSEEKLKHQALVRYFKDQGIDAVLAEYGPTSTRVMQVCKEAKVALITHFHGFDAYEHKTLNEFGQAYKEMFQIADAVVVVSSHMVQQVVSLGAPSEKVHHVPCGMNAQLFHSANPALQAPIFLSTGRFVDKKAPHLLILTFAQVVKAVPDAKLIMVGDGPLLDSAMWMAKSLGLSRHIEFPGAKKHHEVAELMRQVRGFVQHSVTAHSGDSEGTPVAVMEAGGCGLPVVATHHAGIPDVILDEKTGFLVNEGDINQMAKRIIELAQNPSLAERLGKAAQERIKAQFTLEQSIQKLGNIISSAVKDKR